MTPDEYEQVCLDILYQDFFDHHHHDVQACGSKTRKYLESITTDYGPLKTLTASGCAIIHLVDCVKYSESGLVEGVFSPKSPIFYTSKSHCRTLEAPSQEMQVQCMFR